MGKREDRQAAIRDIVRRQQIRTQRGLADQLKQRGFECTQATVSRDIGEIGLLKSAQGFYALPEDMLDYLEALPLTPEERQAIYCDNAIRLLDWPV